MALPEKQPKPGKNEINAAALEAFFNIAKKWNLKDSQQMKLLGDVPSATFYNWKKTKRGALTKDLLDRISYILGIYKALHLLFSDENQADAWIHKKNRAFSNYSALDVMLGGSIIDLARVRAYLDAQRGW